MALEGTLQDMSLSDLLQVFRLGPKSGMLLLTHGAERGVLYIAAGRLIDAFIVRGEDRTVLATRDEAVLQLLDWEDAAFVFHHNAEIAKRVVRMQRDAETLVLEGLRRRANPAKALPYQHLTLETCLQLAPLPNSAESGVSLGVNQWRVLSQVPNSRDLQEISTTTGLEPEIVIRVVAELVAIGLVEVAPISKPAPAAAPSEEDLADEGEANISPTIAATLLGEGGSAQNGEAKNRAPKVGRSLLDAILRRVNEL
jgi:hypothetical protein